MRKGKCQISHWFMRVSMKSCSQYFNGGRGTQRRSPENQILEHWRVSVCYKSLRSLAVFKYRTQSYINYSWIFKKFTVIQLIYNVLLIFALQQSNSVLRVCVCVCTRACIRVQSLQSCPILCHPMDHSPPCCSVHGILQARILEWVARPSSRGSSWPRDWTCVSCIGRQVLHH